VKFAGTGLHGLSYNLGSAMLRTTSDDMECGMWKVECGMMYKREVRIDM
jgi:hypothetical protein